MIGPVAAILGLVALSAEAQVRSTVEFLSSLGSRVSGYPGAEQAAAFVEHQLRQAGVEEVEREEFSLAVPLDRGGQLQVEDSGEVFQIHGLWPNLVAPSTLPPGGLSLPLLWGGTGEWEELAGDEVAGRAVLLEFNSWNHWLRAASLGARVLVFIEPEQTTWVQAEAKIGAVPLEMPRFWIGRAAGQALRQRLEQGEAQVRLEARMEWAQRPAWNIWGMVPGRDPALRDELIAVAAYYDGSSVVPALAPSAEMASSAAALIELARHLRENPPGRSVALVATGAHFQGRQGIVDFLDRHARQHPYYAARLEEPLAMRLFIGLDLSTQTDQMGIWNNTYSYDLKRFFVPLGRRFTHYAEEEGLALANGISPLKGMDWSTFVPGGLSLDSEVALQAGLVSLALATVNDARFGVDTPLDLPARVNFENLERQSRLLNGVLSRAFSDPQLFADLEDFGPVLKDELRSLRVAVRTFPQRSQVPDRPVAGAVVAVDFPYRHKGVEWTRYLLSDAEGQAEARGLEVGGMPVVAYALDPESGRIAYAPDLGERAGKFHGEAIKDGGGSLAAAIRWDYNEKFMILFPCVSSAFYGLIDPRQLTALRELKVLDPNGVAPRQVGYALGPPAGVVYGAPGEALKLLMGKGQRLMLLNSPGGGSEQEARGAGYPIGQGPLVPTELLAVRDMWRLDEARLQTMRRHAIENQRLSRLHQRGAELIRQAEEAWAARQWPQYVAAVRAALGMTARAYPEVLGTLNDVIRGMVFFLALVIPAAFFGERLLLAAADIRRQLAGFGALLGLIWLAISQIHPAFEIAHPLVILLGFAIMAMACFVLALITGRFNRHMKERRARQARVHETDISRSSAAYVAFMLGISNMRRRKLRTGLTLTTLTLLTFTVLSFTAFRDQVRFLAFGLPYPGPYPGCLIRDRGWNPLSGAVLDYSRSHFGEGVCPRSWYISLDELQQQKRYVEARRGERTERALGLLGVSPGEAQLTGMDQVLSAGSFFARQDEHSCLVPDEMAQRLGISPQEVGRARLQVFGRELVVRGLVDSRRLDELRDLDHEPLTPADFQLSSTQALGPAALLEMSGERQERRTQVKPFVHLPAENVLILPYQTLREAGGTLRSVAVRFAGEEGRSLVEELLLRLDITLFASQRDPQTGELRVFSYTSVGLTEVEGLGALLVPIAIAALIVLNAMLGAVYERFREIGIYSSVGLAPSHIAWLFIAESCVYAVIGTTLGYILGQGMGRGLIWAGLVSGVNLNYSSMAAITASLLVMGVVLLSTVYPARLAAQTAVPDTVRRWQPPPPEGERWSFAFPFMIGQAEVMGLCGFLANYFGAYSEESLGLFFSEEVRIVKEGEERAVQLLLWLAPFDLGVSQYLQVEFAPSGVRGACGVEVFIQRISGQDAFWQRANLRFVNRLRREFLLWHTLAPQDRAYHRQTAERMLTSPPGPLSVPERG